MTCPRCSCPECVAARHAGEERQAREAERLRRSAADERPVLRSMGVGDTAEAMAAARRDRPPADTLPGATLVLDDRAVPRPCLYCLRSVPVNPYNGVCRDCARGSAP